MIEKQGRACKILPHVYNSGSGESWFTSGGLRFEPRRGNAEGGSPRRFFMGIGLPGSPLLPSHPATGKDVDFVHPRSMSW